MFVGHFAAAYVLWRLFPQVPLPVILVAVSFPDLLWSVLVPAGLEKVRINPDTPLQKFIVFQNFPYSHSLVLGTGFSLIAGTTLGLAMNNSIIIPVFALGSASHWLLDTVVHLKDLPVLGFDGDAKVGFGLWRRGGVAFIAEITFYVAVSAIALSGLSLLYALALGGIFHAINANSFLGKGRKNPVRSSNAYAGLALAGFGAFTLLASILV